MNRNKAIFFSTVMFVSLISNLTYFSVLPQSPEVIPTLDQYSIVYTNNSIILSIKTKVITNATIITYVDHHKVLYEDNNSLLHIFSVSYPGKELIIFGLLQSNYDKHEVILQNKTIFQPLPLIIVKYPHITSDNKTAFTFKTNIELNTDISHVTLINESKSDPANLFYTFDRVLTTNTSIVVADHYYRYFTTNLTVIKPITNITINPPIIIINGTLDPPSSLVLINKTISFDHLIADTSIITSSVFRHSSLLTNSSNIVNSTFLFSQLLSQKNASIDYSTFENSSLEGKILNLKNMNIINSTLTCTNLSLTNATIVNSVITANYFNYSNVTFSNLTSSSLVPKSFNYTVDYQIINQTTIRFKLTSDVPTNISINLISSTNNYSVYLFKQIDSFSYQFNNVIPALYNISISIINNALVYYKTFLLLIQDTNLTHNPPALLNYQASVDYTSISSNFTFSEPVTGIIYLQSNTTVVRSQNLYDQTFTLITQNNLNPFAVYHFKLNLVDSFNNTLDLNLSNFKLKPIVSHQFTVSIPQKLFSNSISTVNISSVLLVNNISLTNYSVLVNFSFIGGKFQAFITSMVSSLSLNSTFLQSLPDSVITVSLTILPFGYSITKFIQLYNRSLLTFSFTHAYDSSRNDLTFSIQTSVLTNISLLYGPVSLGFMQLLLTNSTFVTSHPFVLTNLLTNSDYNISFTLISLDNQIVSYNQIISLGTNIPLLQVNIVPSIYQNATDNSVTFFTSSNINSSVQLTIFSPLYQPISLIYPDYALQRNLTFHSLHFCFYKFYFVFSSVDGQVVNYNTSLIFNDTFPPTISGYNLKTGFTNVSLNLAFSEPINGSVILMLGSLKIYAYYVNNSSNISIIISSLFVYSIYYFAITVSDGFNQLNTSLPPFSLETISSITLDITSDKTIISRSDTTLLISPILHLNNQTFYDSNYTMNITFLYSSGKSDTSLYKYKNSIVYLDSAYINILPNSLINLTVCLPGFNACRTLILILYNQIKLNFTVVPTIQQNSTSNTLQVTFQSNINTTLTYYLLTTNNSIIKNDNQNTINHSMIFMNLSLSNYNLTIAITSWDGQSAYYYYYFKLNDTTPPVILGYSIKPGFTNFTFTIKLSEPSNVVIQTISTTTGQVKNSYINYFYDTNFTFSVSNLAPYDTYIIYIVAVDSNTNQLSYNITNIHLKPIFSKSISASTNKSVILTTNNIVYISAFLILNGAIYQDQLILSTNLTVASYNISTSSFLVYFDVILLTGLNKDSIICVTLTDNLFNVTTNLYLMYVIADGQKNINSFLVSSNSSFISNAYLKLTLSASFNDSTIFDPTTIVEIRLHDQLLSLGYFKILTSSHIFNQTILINLTSFVLTGKFNSLFIILYGNGVFKTVNQTIQLQVYQVSYSLPEVLTNTIINQKTSKILSVTTNEPVNIRLMYGNSTTSFSFSTCPRWYITATSFNLSALMTFNSYNYYYLILTDSLGNSATENNNSYYFKVFIPYLLTPLNVTTVEINSNYYIQFITNEPVTISATCTDYFGDVFTCYSTIVYGTTISGLLTLSLHGMNYTLTKVKLMDLYGNNNYLYPNITFYY